MANEAKHRPITVCTITHIPVISGYWAHALEITKLFFESLFANTQQAFDLAVFDNGSCSELRQFLVGLHEGGRIQTLILSERNIGKTGALNQLLLAAAGEYIAYADSDLYFLPGWLEASLKVLGGFPEAAKVSALPIVMDRSSDYFQRIFAKALEEARSDPTVTINEGHLVADAFIDAHRKSLGEGEHQYRGRISDRRDILLSRRGCSALLSGADFQFTLRGPAAQTILPLRSEAAQSAGDAIYAPALEMQLAARGYWQLSTPGYYVHHMGNEVPDWKNELPWLSPADVPNRGRSKSAIASAKSRNTAGLLRRFAHVHLVRQVLKKIHLHSYRLLYE